MASADTDTTPAVEEVKETPLYGGAMQASIPAGFLDVSQLRDVPDHQEVFVNNDTDCSIIIELNARCEEASNSKVARHIFDDLAEYNSATGSSVDVDEDLASSYTPNFSDSIPKRCLVGTQTVSKYNESKEAANNVQIYMAVIRLEAQETDITIMMNVPISVSVKSASAKVMKELADANDMAKLFLQVVKTFKINDMSLFT